MLACFLLAATAHAASVTIIFDDLVDPLGDTDGSATISLVSADPGTGTITFDATGATLTGYSLNFGTYVTRAVFFFGTRSLEVTGNAIVQTSTNTYGTHTVAGAGAEFGPVISTSSSGEFVCSNNHICFQPGPPDQWGVPTVLGETQEVEFFLDTFIDADNFSGRIEYTVMNFEVGTTTEFYSFSTIPEPGTGLLMGSGLLGLAFARGRSRYGTSAQAAPQQPWV